MTQHPCPKSPSGDPHHLIPRRVKTNSRGEAVMEMTCSQCGRTEAQLRADADTDSATK